MLRCVALAEELQHRGHHAELSGSLGGVTWVERLVARLGIPVLSPARTPRDVVAAAEARGWDALVTDSYDLDPGCIGAVRRTGRPTVAIVDGDLRGQDADLYVDQNVHAERRMPDLPTGARRLAGLRYVLVRDDVLSHRRATPPANTTAGPHPQLIAFFGGTDPFGAAKTMVPIVLATSLPCRLTVLASSPELQRHLPGFRREASQQVEVRQPGEHLPALVAQADLAISASGTSLLETLCIGTPAAAVVVVENQQIGYDAVTSARLAVGLGTLAGLREDTSARRRAVDEIGRLVRDRDRLHDMALRGMQAVDGRGRERVAEALEALLRLDDQ